MNMQNNDWNKFAKDIEAALKEVGDQYGIDLRVKGNFRYSLEGTGSVAFKMEAHNRGKGGETVDPFIADLEKGFANYAYRYNLEGQLGAEFKANGASYTVIGMKPRSKTRPIVVKRKDGKMFKMTAETVQRGLGLEVTPNDIW